MNSLILAAALTTSTWQPIYFAPRRWRLLPRRQWQVLRVVPETTVIVRSQTRVIQVAPGRAVLRGLAPRVYFPRSNGPCGPGGCLTPTR